MHQVTQAFPVAGPWITEKEVSYVTDAVTRCWYADANEYIDRFESAFKTYLGRRFAITLPSCTSALHLSLLALGVTEGDEVIVPDATWIASAAPISYVGAKPVFVDIDPNNWCLSVNSVEAAITSKTKAIIVVNLYGNMPDWDGLLALSSHYDIPLIEDAAESIGSIYKGKLSGSLGLASCFSFHGSKTLTTGEGGMLVTDDEDVYNKCMMYRDHGRLPGDIMFQNIMVGFKYKMSSLQAALGLAQLERIDELVAKKKEIFSWYKTFLSDYDLLRLNPECPEVDNSFWMSTLIFDERLAVDKRKIMYDLKQNGVHTRPFFDPLTSLEAYGYLKQGKSATVSNPNSYDISSRAINLPSALCLTKDDVFQVCTFIVGGSLSLSTC